MNLSLKAVSNPAPQVICVRKTENGQQKSIKFSDESNLMAVEIDNSLVQVSGPMSVELTRHSVQWRRQPPKSGGDWNSRGSGGGAPGKIFQDHALFLLGNALSSLR